MAKSPQAMYRSRYRELIRTYDGLEMDGILSAKNYVRQLQDTTATIISTAAPYELQYYSAFSNRVRTVASELESLYALETKHLQNAAYLNGGAIIDDSILSVGITLDLPPLPVANLRVAQEFSADLISGLNDDAIKMINNQISLDLLAGRSSSDTQASIRDILYKEPPPNVVLPGERAYSIEYRSEMISRTEINRAQSMATENRLFQAKEFVPDLQYRLDIAPDACDKCTPFQDLVFDIGEGPDVPIHPECRCVKVPYKEDWETNKLEYTDEEQYEKIVDRIPDKDSSFLT